MKIVILKFFLVNALMITVNHTVVYKNISYIYRLYLVVFFYQIHSRFPSIGQCFL